MSDITALYLLSLSIIFAAVAGAIRFRKIDPSYHPFIYYAWLSVVTETVVYIIIRSGKGDEIAPYVYNIFHVAEFFLLSWMFHNWGLFKRRKSVFIAINVFFLLLYLSTLYMRGHDKLNYFACIANSFALIFFSISAFNTMIVNERTNIFKNPKFWICIGMIIYFTYFILVYTEKLNFLDIKRSDDLKQKIWLVQAVSNLFVNFLYALAVIWIPRKKNTITLL